MVGWSDLPEANAANTRRMIATSGSHLYQKDYGIEYASEARKKCAFD
jgi:hypothetical protein